LDWQAAFFAAALSASTRGGPAAAPVVLLLHGFPTSSRMFRNLIPMLADKYRVIAPDYPAFGHSAVPSRADFEYTHAHLSEVMEALLEMAKAPSSPLTSIILMPSDVEQITRRDRPTAQARILRLLA
jgi:pimeloyl-ACP methyl ester carboxylesterase